MQLPHPEHGRGSATECGDVRLRAIFWILLGLLVAHALFVLFRGLDNPLRDANAFRQTQTALTSYWLREGGPFLAYQTPVLGYPWSIPMELPVYQLLAASLAKTGVPLDAAGRIVSFAFFLATLWPLHMLFKAMELGPVAFPATAILYLASPLYLFRSRTFLIEPSALFFCSLWLALLARYLGSSGPMLAFAGTLAGTLGILVKATTFPSFAVLGACLAAQRLWRDWRNGKPMGERAVVGATAVCVIAVPFLVGFAWTYASDQIKSENELGAYLTSRALMPWSFGTAEQRIGTGLWVETVQRRVLLDLFGPLFLLAAAVWGATLGSHRYAVKAALALVAFVIPFLLFTNLHVIHNYYQYANGLFAISAVGLGIASIAKRRGVLALCLIGVLAASQLSFFRLAYWPLVTKSYDDDRLLRIALRAKDKTSTGDGLIVIGDDWASTIPYYSERRALAIPGWIPVSLMERMLADPQRYLGGDRFAGVVYCADQLPTYGERAPLLQRFVAGRAELGSYGGCQLLAPTR